MCSHTFSEHSVYIGEVGMKEGSGREEFQYKGMDVIKFVMSVFVVVLHTHPFYGVSDGLNFVTADVLGRVAVPFFFAATGFLLQRKKETGNVCGKDIIKEYVCRILKLYLIWTAVYLPVIVYTNIISSNKGIQYGVFTSVRDFIFAGSYAHLWYLPATAVGVCIAFFLTEKIGEGRSGGFLFLLFLAGLLAQSYYGVLSAVIEEGGFIWNGLRLVKKVMVTTRNGIFFGSFFIYMGSWTARRYEKIRLKTGMIWLGAAISAVLLTLEEIWLHRLGFVREEDMYLMLVPAAFFLLLVSLRMDIRMPTALLRRMSMNIYFIHLLFKFLYRQFLGEYNENGWKLFLFTLCGTLFFAYLLCKVQMGKVRDGDGKKKENL